MPCCGKARQHLAQVTATTPAEAAPARPAPRFSVVFEYTGQTAMTVVGSASGRRYRFAGPGARVVVDPRDRPGLARVPKLREVR
jgi:hypothetical protein